MWDDDEPRSPWRKTGGWIWGALQVAMLIGCIVLVSFGIYSLFLARLHHHF